MELGSAALIGQGIGAFANIVGGAIQRNRGKKAYEEGREDFIGNVGASDALASFSDEQASLANLAGDRANEKADSALAGLIAAQKSGDPRFMRTLGIDQLAGAELDRGLKTAQNIASARSPLVQAEEKARDQMTGLYGQDMAGGAAAFQQGTENIMGGVGAFTNAPMDLLGLATASKGDLGDAWNTEIFAGGGTIERLIAEGGSFVTPGAEDHSTQEYNIVDSETGETVAATTGGERHENTEEGLSITNSEQDQGMMDAFTQIRDPKNPTVAEGRNAVLAMAKVYGLKQFNNNVA